MSINNNYNQNLILYNKKIKYKIPSYKNQGS